MQSELHSQRAAKRNPCRPSSRHPEIHSGCSAAHKGNCRADEDISIWQGDIKAATNVRDIEEVDYDALHKDYSESVDALQHPSQF